MLTAATRVAQVTADRTKEDMTAIADPIRTATRQVDTQETVVLRLIDNKATSDAVDTATRQLDADAAVFNDALHTAIETACRRYATTVDWTAAQNAAVAAAASAAHRAEQAHAVTNRANVDNSTTTPKTAVIDAALAWFRALED